jgi:hypothetical protein
MSQVETRTDVYELEGSGIKLEYRRCDGKLNISGGDDHLLNTDNLDAEVAVEPDTGLHVTATLLDSSRNGTRVTLTLLLPELRETPGRLGTMKVTGVAIVTSSFRDLVDGQPPVLQSQGEVHRLEGTARYE